MDEQPLNDTELEPLDESDDSEGYVPVLTNLADDSRLVTPEELGFYEHHRFVVDVGQKPFRIDVYLTMYIRNATRTRIQNAIRAGLVRCNDVAVKASYQVKPNDIIVVFLPYPPSPDLVSEDIPLNIIFEDDDLMIVNKAAGMVCHPASGHFSGTLVNALLFHLNQVTELDPQSLRPGLVHRIDKDTSGLLVIAKNIHAFNFLAKQFFEHTIERTYLAIVWGNIAQDSGTITGHIGRHPVSRKKFTVVADASYGKHAVTHYQVLQRFGFFTLVRCRLETGRTHQIRVHFKHIGHPLLGDVFYGGDKITGTKLNKTTRQFLTECLELMQRQSLHAKTLGFIHPRNQQYVQHDSVLPDDFQAVLKKITDFSSSIHAEIKLYIADFERYQIPFVTSN